MRSPVPATQGSAPEAHSSLKRRIAGGRIPQKRSLGFPQPRRERRLGLPPHPRPKCQVSSRGGGSSRGLPSRAAQTAKSTPHRGPRPRACTHSYTLTLWRIHTLTRAQTHTLSDVLPRRRQRPHCGPRALFQLSDGRGARGGAAEKLITDSADYCGSLC